MATNCHVEDASSQVKVWILQSRERKNGGERNDSGAKRESDVRLLPHRRGQIDETTLGKNEFLGFHGHNYGTTEA